MPISPYKSEAGKDLIVQSYQNLLGQWQVPVQEVDIPSRFGVTHVVVAGAAERPPLLLFHGVGDNSALMWVYNIQALARHFYVIAIDTMGGPGKSVPNETYKKSFDAAVWIDEIMAWFKLEAVHVAGVSNGAYLASYYTITNPAKVRKMVGMAGGIKTNMLRMAMVFLPEALLPASEKTTRKLLRKLCAPSTSAVFEDNPEIMTHWTYLLKYFNNRTMMYHKYRRFTKEELSILKEKAVFLIGEYDKLSYYPSAIQSLQLHQIPYMIVPDAGHGINHEQSDRVNELITDFLVRDVIHSAK